MGSGIGGLSKRRTVSRRGGTGTRHKGAGYDTQLRTATKATGAERWGEEGGGGECSGTIQLSTKAEKNDSSGGEVSINPTSP